MNIPQIPPYLEPTQYFTEAIVRFILSNIKITFWVVIVLPFMNYKIVSIEDLSRVPSNLSGKNYFQTVDMAVSLTESVART